MDEAVLEYQGSAPLEFIQIDGADHFFRDIDRGWEHLGDKKRDSLLRRLPEKEAEFVRLKRLNEIREKFYLLLLERQAEFEIARAGLVSDYVLLERA